MEQFLTNEKYGLEKIVDNPRIYIGNVNNPNCLVYELINNSIDEANKGYGRSIKVIIKKDNSVTVKDKGRGLSDAIEVFSKITNIMHGIGCAKVNALSNYVNIRYFKDDKEYSLAFKNNGREISLLKEVSKSKKVGTEITFKADNKYFKNDINYVELYNFIQQKSYFNKVKFELKDERIVKFYVKKDGVIQCLVDKYGYDSNKVKSFNKKSYDTSISVAYVLTNKHKFNCISFANGINTIDGGVHVDGLLRAFKNVFQTDDISVDCVVSVSIPNNMVEFQGLNLNKLGNNEVENIVYLLCKNKLNNN